VEARTISFPGQFSPPSETAEKQSRKCSAPSPSSPSPPRPTPGDSLTRLMTTTLASILGAEAESVDMFQDNWRACGGALHVRFMRNDFLDPRARPRYRTPRRFGDARRYPYSILLDISSDPSPNLVLRRSDGLLPALQTFVTHFDHYLSMRALPRPRYVSEKCEALVGVLRSMCHMSRLNPIHNRPPPNPAQPIPNITHARPPTAQPMLRPMQQRPTPSPPHTHPTTRPTDTALFREQMQAAAEALTASMHRLHGEGGAILVVRNTVPGHWECVER